MNGGILTLGWTCCCSVVWEKISNKAATESSYIQSRASEPAGTWIFQNRDGRKSVQAYLCETTEVAKTCGEEAYRAYFAMGKVKDSVKGIRFSCSSIDFEKELSTGFFSLFQINPDEAYIYNEVLDYLKVRMQPDVYEG
ncbi:hypothetical protein TNCV_854691 [Trichonephila clavipes]|nr:hypothetical protein TNCV_854691 [Trichonephila clavipes]